MIRPVRFQNLSVQNISMKKIQQIWKLNEVLKFNIGLINVTIHLKRMLISYRKYKIDWMESRKLIRTLNRGQCRSVY